MSQHYSQLPSLEYATQDMSMVSYGKKRAYPSTTGPSKLARSGRKTVRKYRSRYSFYAPAAVQTKTGFPGFMKMTHRYSAAVRITGLAGAVSSYIFSANGLYDPDVSGTGHQPMYFDQLGSIYNHYCVMKSRIKVQMIPVVASAGCQSVRCVLYLQDLSSPSSINTAIERSKSNWTVISHLSNTFGPQNKLSLGWNGFETFGNKIVSDENYQGSTGANPVEQSYFILSFQDAAAAGIAVMDVQFTVEYDTVWTELAANAGS